MAIDQPLLKDIPEAETSCQVFQINEAGLKNPREVEKEKLRKWVQAYVGHTSDKPDLPTAVNFKIDDVIDYLVKYKEQGALFVRLYHCIGENWNGRNEIFSFLLPLKSTTADNPIVDSSAIKGDKIEILNECCHCPPCLKDEMQKR